MDNSAFLRIKQYILWQTANSTVWRENLYAPEYYCPAHV